MIPLDPQSRDLLVRTIFGEAGMEPEAGQAAVAHVILNRMKAGRYGGNTLRDVVMAPNQFEPWNDPAARQRMEGLDPNGPTYRRLASVADAVLGGQMPDPTGGATHFLNPEIVRQRRGGSLPAWAAGQGQTIGRHAFFTPDEDAAVRSIPRSELTARPPELWRSIPPGELKSLTANLTGGGGDETLTGGSGGPSKLDLMLEAERRGILPPDKAALLAEARKRGLAPEAAPQPKAADPRTGTAMPGNTPAERLDAYTAALGKGTQAALRGTANVGLSALQGATMGFSDEAGAGIESAVTGKPYDKALEENRTRLRQIAPEVAIPAEIGGAVATGLATGGLGMAGAGGLGSAMLRAGALGATEGALAGAGFAEGGTENRLKGAAIGGAAGLAAGTAAPPIVRGIQRGLTAATGIGGRSAAGRKVAEAFQRDQVSPAEAEARLSAYGDEAILADLGGENVRGLARGAAGRPGEAKDLASSVLEGRNLRQGDRLHEVINSTLSGENFQETVDGVIRARKAAAAPFYDEARKAGELDSPEISELLVKSKDIQAAIRQARRLPEYADLPDNDIVLLDKAYKNIGGKWRAAKRAGDDEMARDLNNLRTSLRAAITDQVPVYGKALEAFSDDSAVLDALNAGRKALTQEPELTAKDVARLSSAEREGYVIGVARAIKDIVDRTPDTADAARRVFGNKAIRERIEAAFPDPATFERFQNQVLGEVQFAQTRNAVLSGSRTAPMLAEMDDAGVLPKTVADLTMAGMYGGKWGIASYTARRILSTAAQPGGNLRAELGRLLFTPGVSQNKAILRMVTDSIKQGRLTSDLEAALTSAASVEGGQALPPAIDLR